VDEFRKARGKLRILVGLVKTRSEKAGVRNALRAKRGRLRNLDGHGSLNLERQKDGNVGVLTRYIVSLGRRGGKRGTVFASGANGQKSVAEKHSGVQQF